MDEVKKTIGDFINKERPARNVHRRFVPVMHGVEDRVVGLYYTIGTISWQGYSGQNHVDQVLLHVPGTELLGETTNHSGVKECLL